MGPALIMRKRRTRRPVQLTDDDSLGPVDDKRPALGHERQFPDIDFLLADIEHFLARTLIFLIQHHQTDTQLQRNREGHTLLKTFSLVVLWRP